MTDRAAVQIAQARHFVMRIRFTQYVGEILRGELAESEIGPKMDAAGEEFDQAMKRTAEGLYDAWFTGGAGRDHDFVGEFRRLKAKIDRQKAEL